MAVRNDHYNYISRGFPVGFVTPANYKQPNVHCLYNHMRIVVKYNEDAERFQGSRIVGFEVVPFSVKHQWDSQGGKAAFDPQATVLETCNDDRHVKYEAEGFQTVEEPVRACVWVWWGGDVLGGWGWFGRVYGSFSSLLRNRAR